MKLDDRHDADAWRHDGTYLVTWNGHGDALAISRDQRGRDAHPGQPLRLLDLGRAHPHGPTGYGDLGFRYRYVGAAGVAVGQLRRPAVHAPPATTARSSAASSSRTPAAEENLYAYTGNSPVSRVDPSGTWLCVIPVVGWSICGLVVRFAVAAVTYAPRLLGVLGGAGITAIHHSVSEATLQLERLGHIVQKHGQMVTNATLLAQDGVRLTTLERTTRWELSNGSIVPAIRDTLLRACSESLPFGSMGLRQRR